MKKERHGADARINNLAAVGISISLTLLFLAAGSVYTQQRSETATRKLIFASYASKDNLDAILSAVKDAETGQRGYILTGSPEYLDNYKDGCKILAQRLVGLEMQLKDFSDGQDKAAEISKVISSKMAELQQTIDLRSADKTNEALAIVRNHSGKHDMDRLRNVIGDLKMRLDLDLQDQLKELEQSDRWLLTASVIFLFLALGTIAAFSIGIIFLLNRLLKNNAKFEAIFDNSFSFIGMLSTDGRLLETNKTSLKFAEINNVDVLGRYFWDTIWFKDAPEAQAILKRAVTEAASGARHRSELQIPGRSGVVTIDFSLTPIRDEAGNIIYLVPEGRDISQRKLLEEQQTLLSDNERKLASSQEISDGLLQDLLQSICRLLDFKVGAVWHKSAHEDTLHSQALWAADSPTLAPFIANTKTLTLKMGEGLAGRVWQNAGIEQILDITKDSYFLRADTALEASLHSAIAVPYFTENNVAGVIEFFSERKLQSNEEKVLSFLRVFAGQIGQHLEREKARLQKESLARQTKTILENLGEGVYQLNSSGVATYWNSGAEKLLGYTPEEALGKNIHELIHHSNLDRSHRPAAECHLLDVMVSGEPYSNYDDVFVHSDGSFVEVAYSSAPLFEEGKVVGTIVVFRDIKVRKEADRRVAEFYATVSHELRTPLTSIRGSLGLVEGGLTGEIPPKAMQFISIARDQCDRLVRLINDILDIKKIEIGKLELNLTDVEAQTIMNRCLESLKGMSAEYSVQLRALQDDLQGDKDAAQSKPVLLHCDQDRITQVLTNLISNAIKFSPKDGEVLVKLEETPEHRCKFSITDHGQGIPANQKHKLFGKFQQLDASDARAKGGTGLGLAISKAIVDEHGGKIDLESEVGKGTTFWFELPLANMQN